MRNQRRDVDFIEPLERRDVYTQRHDVVNPTLCNVATLPRTSRRRLVQHSVTSRRCPERRDVGFNPLCNVATLPYTSRRCPVLRPRTVHFCSSPRTHHYRNPRPLAHLSSPALPEPPSTPVGSPYIALQPPLRTSESPVPTGSGSLWHSHHTVLGSSLGVVF